MENPLLSNSSLSSASMTDFGWVWEVGRAGTNEPLPAKPKKNGGKLNLGGKLLKSGAGHEQSRA